MKPTTSDNNIQGKDTVEPLVPEPDLDEVEKVLEDSKTIKYMKYHQNSLSSELLNYSSYNLCGGRKKYQRSGNGPLTARSLYSVYRTKSLQM